MHCSHRQRRSIFFSVKTPFTHQFQITCKFCEIINQKLPLNNCASRFCACKHEGVYTVSVFVDLFLFLCLMFIFMQRFCSRDSFQFQTELHSERRVNASSASECYDWSRAFTFWISMALDWPRVVILHHCILNSHMLIPAIFILCSHTSFWQFTGNVTTSHTSKLPEQMYRYF